MMSFFRIKNEAENAGKTAFQTLIVEVELEFGLIFSSHLTRNIIHKSTLKQEVKLYLAFLWAQSQAQPKFYIKNLL